MGKGTGFSGIRIGVKDFGPQKNPNPNYGYSRLVTGFIQELRSKIPNSSITITHNHKALSLFAATISI